MYHTVEWKISKTFINYDVAISEMEKRVKEIKNNSSKELLWFLQHKSIYTAGTSAKIEDLINKNVEKRFSGRGGQWTWHGPGQRIVYIMLNLKKRNPDIKAFVNSLEEWIILTLKEFSINGIRLKNKPGVWIKDKNNHYNKIAALGIRITSWISWHGISINLNPDISKYNNIIPCGISDGGITSITNLNKNITFEQLDQSLIKNFNTIFGEGSLFEFKLLD